jgi:hypothetical protein
VIASVSPCMFAIPMTDCGAQSGRSQANRKRTGSSCALRFELPPKSRPSMVCLYRASYFCRAIAAAGCRAGCTITGRCHADTNTASCRAIISHQITAFQLTLRKPRFRARRVTTGALGVSIKSQVITGTMATGSISGGLAFSVGRYNGGGFGPCWTRTLIGPIWNCG